MRIAIVNNSDRLGGASRAAYSLAKALRANGMDAFMHVTRATGAITFVKGPTRTAMKAWGTFRFELAQQIKRAARPADNSLRSIVLLPWGRVAALNADSVDLVNLH
jgi:hypothetical protein